MPAKPRLNEAKLHDLWRRQALPAAILRTREGQPLEIINPGRHNSDAGPDFRRATLRLEGRLVQGDIELHLDAADWYSHGHHLDPAYNQVVLHVALRELSTAAPDLALRRENGLPVPQLLLPQELVQPIPDPPAALLDCPLSRTSPAKILATVRHAGRLRLETKAAAFAEAVAQTSWDQAVYRGIAEAIGYDKNQEPFRRLAELFPIDLLFAELRVVRDHEPQVLLEAMLFGAAGFLSHWPARTVPAEVADFVAARRHLWEQLRHSLQIRPLRPEAWQFFRLRPQNFPTRRLAGLCALILKFCHNGILEHLVSLVQTLGGEPRALVAELLGYFVCPAGGIWRTHYGLREHTHSLNANLGDLIGRERALDILANIILPGLWHYYREAGDFACQNQMQEIYARLPRLQENHLTRAMRQQLAAQFPLRREVATTAREQQGLLYLQKLFCRPGRCEECLSLQ